MVINNKWFIDKDSKHRWIYHKIKRHLLSAKTEFQKIKLVDTYNFGRIVILDNKIQSSETDEFIYHEALVHPAMITHPDPENILILGGGEGATLREVLKHPTVKNVVMVDIDEEFVNICRSHLENWHRNSFDNRKVKLIFADAIKYIKDNKFQFDIIIADISDPIEKGPAQQLYTNKFYSDIKINLKPDGIFVTHVTEVHHFLNKSLSVEIFRTLTDIFPVAEFYYEYIPSFSSLWAFSSGSLKYSLKKMTSTLIKRRLKERKLKDLLYYDEETHERLFCLPKHIRELLFNS